VTPMNLFLFGLIVLSSVVAAWADIQAALQHSVSASNVASAAQLSTLNAGYMWMLFKGFCNASFVLGLRKLIKLTNFKAFDTMFYNNLLFIVIQLVCSLYFEDWSSSNLERNFPAGSRNTTISAMVISGLSSVIISYSSAWRVRVTSSTTYSMTGVLNKLPVALSGLVFFDAPVTVGSVSAIALGFISGFVYAVAKIRQTEARIKQESLPISELEADGLKAKGKSEP
jgi:GDP-mannose transporter